MSLRHYDTTDAPGVIAREVVLTGASEGWTGSIAAEQATGGKLAPFGIVCVDAPRGRWARAARAPEGAAIALELRLAPGADPDEAFGALVDTLLDAPPSETFPDGIALGALARLR
jgi:hypothetical protein